MRESYMRNVRCLLASAVVLLAGEATAEMPATADVVTVGAAAAAQDTTPAVDLTQGKGTYTPYGANI